MTERDHLADLYSAHVRILTDRFGSLLASTPWRFLVIGSGSPMPVFADDQFHPYRVGPAYRQWVPVDDHQNSYLVISPGDRPRLICHQPVDYWHVVPQPPSGIWVDHFEIESVPTADAAIATLPRDPADGAFIGDPSGAIADVPFASFNPPDLTEALDCERVFKTAYEVECMRRANRIGAAGHLAARERFFEGGGEFDIHLAYLRATRQAERDLPYPNIVALNEHGATLHYDVFDDSPPADSLSFLMDAGAGYLGYASDITRTWTTDEGEFRDLVERVDRAQQAIVNRIAIGMSYVDLHVEMHLALAGILHDVGFVDMTPEAMVDSGVSSVFFPHGLGHHIGLQVHDVGGKLRHPGEAIEQPDGHPFLRNLRPIEAGNVFTIEPGIYFIDSLLTDLRDRSESRTVDWERIERMRRFGGVRIEDDVHVSADGVENLTRDAFRVIED
jgi:Xaa-Pro dipeptidase